MRRCSSDAKLQFISSFSPLTLRYSGNTFLVDLSVLSINDFSILRYGFQSIFFFLPLLWNSSSWRSTRWKYFFNKCFFTHFRRSLYQVRDSYSIWEIDSIYLWYFFWIQPFSEVLFARFYLTVLCIWNYVLWDPLSFGWCFSGWHLINISLPEFLSCPSFLPDQVLSDFLLSWWLFSFL